MKGRNAKFQKARSPKRNKNRYVKEEVITRSVDGSADHDEGQKERASVEVGVSLTICKSRETKINGAGCLIEAGRAGWRAIGTRPQVLGTMGVCSGRGLDHAC
jgi:hypothetical protein